MTDINRIFQAGLTQRWHTNPWLTHTTDRLDGHQGRVARLIIALWPDASRDLIIAALSHDDAESITGDIPYPHGKTTEQQNAEAAARIIVWQRRAPMLSSQDESRLRFADRLDAAMWMLHWAPQCSNREDWKNALTWLDHEATRLGVEDRL